MIRFWIWIHATASLRPSVDWARGGRSTCDGVLAQGLALLAALELPRSVADQTGSGHAKSVLRDLLDRAGNDETGKLWQQLADVLPLLAEAAPGVFLDAIRRDSQGEAPLLRKVFTDSEEFMSSAHTGLLRGLERLCWMPEHLSAAMDALLALRQG